MFDAVYAHYGLNWQFWKCDIGSVEDLPAAIRGAKALGFWGFCITVPCKIACLSSLDALDDDVRVIGKANYVTFEDGRIVGHNNDGKGVVKANDDWPILSQTLVT
jgi:shikimate dehydrogenase